MLAGIFVSEFGEVGYRKVKGWKSGTPREVGKSLAQIGEDDCGAVDSGILLSQFFLNSIV